MKKHIFAIMLLMSLSIAPVQAGPSKNIADDPALVEFLRELYKNSDPKAREMAADIIESYTGPSVPVQVSPADNAIESAASSVESMPRIMAASVNEASTEAFADLPSNNELALDSAPLPRAQKHFWSGLKGYVDGIRSNAYALCDYAKTALQSAPATAAEGLKKVKELDLKAVAASPQAAGLNVLQAVQARPTATAFGGVVGGVLGYKIGSIGKKSDAPVTIARRIGQTAATTTGVLAGAAAGNILMSEELGRVAAATGVTALGAYKLCKSLYGYLGPKTPTRVLVAKGLGTNSGVLEKTEKVDTLSEEQADFIKNRVLVDRHHSDRVHLHRFNHKGTFGYLHILWTVDEIDLFIRNNNGDRPAYYFGTGDRRAEILHPTNGTLEETGIREMVESLPVKAKKAVLRLMLARESLALMGARKVAHQDVIAQYTQNVVTPLVQEVMNHVESR